MATNLSSAIQNSIKSLLHEKPPAVEAEEKRRSEFSLSQSTTGNWGMYTPPPSFAPPSPFAQPAGGGVSQNDPASAAIASLVAPVQQLTSVIQNLLGVIQRGGPPPNGGGAGGSGGGYGGAGWFSSMFPGAPGGSGGSGVPPGGGGPGYPPPPSPGFGGGAGWAARLFGGGGMPSLTPANLLGTLNLANNLYTSYTQPSFQTNLSIREAEMSGRFVSPAAQGLMRTAAEAQGDLGLGTFLNNLSPLSRGYGVTHWLRPAEQRIADLRTMAQTDPLRRGLSAYTGVGELTSLDGDGNLVPDPTMQSRYSAAMALRSFGRSASRGASSYSGIPGLIRRGFNVEEGFGTLTGYGEQNSDIGALLFGGNINTALDLAGNYAAGSGDVSGAASLGVLNPAARQSLIASAIGQAGRKRRVSLSALGVSTSSAALSGLESSGGSYQAIGGALASVGGAQGALLADLQQELTFATNPLDQARLRAQIGQVMAGIAGLPRQSTQVELEQRSMSAGAGVSMAQSAVTRTLFGGGDETALGGTFGRLGGAYSYEARMYRDLASRPGLSASERQHLLSQASEAEVHANVDIPRQLASETFSIGLGRAGVSQAGADASLATARLFGGSREYGAGVEQSIAASRQELAAIGEMMKSQTLSLKERLDLERQSVQVQTRITQQQEERVRGMMAETVAGTSTSQLIATGGLSRAVAGGNLSTASTLLPGALTAAQNRLSAAERQVQYYRRSGISVENPDRRQAEAEFDNAQTELLDLQQSQSRMPLSADTRLGLMNTSFTASALTRTYGSWGNLRGTLASGLGYVRKGMQEIDAREAAARRSGTLTEQMRVEFQQQRLQLGNQGLDYQTQLEQGWQDRLISSVYNAPQSFGLIASQFTMKESAPFLEATSSAFGFRSPVARNYFLHRGPRLASNVIGNITRPEGFLATATSGARPEATVNVRVVVEDSRGNRLGAGQSRGSLYDATQLNIVAPNFNSGHQ